ncbi:MAG: LysR family transcriptional regulator [Oscillospiraceae bacterium]
MSVKLELYRVFKEVAEAGNITAAAQTLFISQSAVSQSIKQLEAELQTRLFARNSRGVTLTADGRMLYEYVRSAMGLLETGEEKLSQSRDLQMGHLTIGASDTVTSQFPLPYLDRFHRQYPAIHIQIISGRSHKVLGLLQSGKVDIAFASTPQEGASLETFPCLATHSIFVAGAEYPCDFDHVYSLEEIARFPLILLERKASSAVSGKILPAERTAPEPGDRAGRPEPLLDLAAIGFGVAGVTEEFVRRELENGRLRKLRTSFDIRPAAWTCASCGTCPDVCGPALQRFYPGEPAPGVIPVICDKTRPGNAGNFALSPPCFCGVNRAE